MSKMYIAKILWKDSSESFSDYFLSKEEAEKELKDMAFAMESVVASRNIIEDDKTELPPELTEESVFYALGGPKEQEEAQLGYIVSRCKNWGTEASDVLMQEAKETLTELRMR